MSQNGFEMQDQNSSRKNSRSSRNRDSYDLNTDLWFAAHASPTESHTTRFIGFSTVLHALLFASILVISQAPKPPEIETITVEIEDLSGPRPMPKGETMRQSKGMAASAGAAASAPPIAQEPITADDVVVPVAPKRLPPPPPPKAAKVKAPTAPAPTPKAAPQRAARAAAPAIVTQETSDVEVPATLDDLDAPDLDESSAAHRDIKAPDDKDLANAFMAVDRAQEDDAARAREAMAADSSALDQESDETLRSVEEAYANDEQRMKQLADERRQQQQESLAALRAQQQADALRRAEAAGQAEAARQQAALMAQRQQQGAGTGAGQGDNRAGRTATPHGGDHAGLGTTGNGGGTSGSPNGQAFGAPKAIRSLEDLRQMPGNPLPSYNEQERQNRQQGLVAYLAYVNKNGVPVDFRQLRSTGYTNLDAKTLQALKKWKFYPGQEGWVEIPFRWDLRGGPQERRALSIR